MAAKTIDVRTPDGTKSGNVELPAELFDVEPNIALMHQVVTAQLAAKRQGTHSTKTRGEVIGGQTPSTKDAKTFLGTLTERRKVLVVIGRSDEVGAKSVRNLPGVHVLSPDQLNTYDVLEADDVVFSVEALDAWISANSKNDEEVSA